MVRNHETPRVIKLLSSFSACIRNSGESCTGTIREPLRKPLPSHRLDRVYRIDWLRLMIIVKSHWDTAFAANSHLLKKVREIQHSLACTPLPCRA